MLNELKEHFVNKRDINKIVSTPLAGTGTVIPASAAPATTGAAANNIGLSKINGAISTINDPIIKHTQTKELTNPNLNIYPTNGIQITINNNDDKKLGTLGLIEDENKFISSVPR